MALLTVAVGLFCGVGTLAGLRVIARFTQDEAAPADDVLRGEYV